MSDDPRLLSPAQWFENFSLVFDRDIGEPEALAALEAEDRLKQHDMAQREQIVLLEEEVKAYEASDLIKSENLKTLREQLANIGCAGMSVRQPMGGGL